MKFMGVSYSDLMTEVAIEVCGRRINSGIEVHDEFSTSTYRPERENPDSR